MPINNEEPVVLPSARFLSRTSVEYLRKPGQSDVLIGLN